MYSAAFTSGRWYVWGFWVLAARFQSHSFMIGDSNGLAFGGRSQGTDPAIIYIHIYEFMNIALHKHLQLRPFYSSGRLRVFHVREHSRGTCTQYSDRHSIHELCMYGSLCSSHTLVPIFSAILPILSKRHPRRLCIVCKGHLVPWWKPQLDLPCNPDGDRSKVHQERTRITSEAIIACTARAEFAKRMEERGDDIPS